MRREDIESELRMVQDTIRDIQNGDLTTIEKTYILDGLLVRLHELQIAYDNKLKPRNPSKTRSESMKKVWEKRKSV